MKGFVMLLVVEASQAEDDHASLVRVCHDFDAATVADLSVAIEHASKSAQRQLRHHVRTFQHERAVQRRRDAIRSV